MLIRAILAAAVVLFGTAVLTVAMVLPVGGDVARSGPTVKVVTNGGNGWGSGVHVGNGYILTAAHVVKSAADIDIKFDDQSVEKEVEVMWVSTKYDLALLRVGKFKKIEFRNLDCSIPAVGTPITVVGNPFEFEWVTSHGFVTSTPQTVYWPMGSGQAVWPLAFAVDADAAPGVSGGPVFNSAGDVVGFLVGRIPGEALRFAVPAMVACNLMGRA